MKKLYTTTDLDVLKSHHYKKKIKTKTKTNQIQYMNLDQIIMDQGNNNNEVLMGTTEDI
jgi:hypothetical protein